MSLERRNRRWYDYLSFRIPGGLVHLYVGGGRYGLAMAREYKKGEPERRRLGALKGHETRRKKAAAAREGGEA